MASEERKAELLEELERKDRLSHPRVVEVVEEFLSTGGDQEEVRKRLVGGFVGYEAISFQLAKWLEELKGDGGSFAEDVLLRCLENFIAKKFDAKSADAKFVESGVIPKWLSTMLADEKWREMLGRIKESYQGSSAVLDYAQRNIDMMKDVEGIAGDSTNGTDPHTLGDPNKFVQLLADSVSTLSTSPSAADLPSNFHRVAKLAGFDERSFIFTLRVLAELRGKPMKDAERDAFYRRLMQEVCLEAAKETSSERDGQLFATRAALYFDSLKSAEVDPRIPDAIMDIISDKATVAAARLVRDHFVGQGYSATELPMIQHPAVLHKLLKVMYLPGELGSRELEARETLSEIVARGCTADEQQLQSLISALKSTSEVCASNPPGVPRSTLQRKVIGPVGDALGHSAVAVGVLFWIERSLTENPKPMELKVVVPYYLHLSSMIAERHPMLGKEVLRITGLAFKIKLPDLDELTTLDIRKIYIDHLVDLSQKGISIAVLNTVESWVKDEDNSLIRTFVKQMLSLAGPPHSTEFARAFLQLISKPEICTAFQEDTEGLDLLRRFVKECTQSGHEIPATITEVL